MTQMQHNGVTLSVRDNQYAAFDRGIVKEVQAHYFWESLEVLHMQHAIDIGAHIGSWSRYLMTLNPAMEIACIEPEPDNFDMLTRNRIEGMTLYQGRCGYTAGDVLLIRSASNSGGHYIAPMPESDNAAPSNAVVITQRVTVEQIMNRQRMLYCDLLKLDCEGSEYDILLNIPYPALARIRCIVGEFHRGQDNFEAQIGTRLRRAGFEIEYAAHPDPAVKNLGMFLARAE